MKTSSNADGDRDEPSTRSNPAPGDLDGDGLEELNHVQELFVRLANLRRHPRYRAALAEGTGFEGRVVTMRLLRSIEALTERGDKPSIREVAERVGMEPANTSRALEHAAELRLVARTPSADDARRTEVTLTRDGRQALTELDARRATVHAQMMHDWRTEEVTELTVLLEKLCLSYEQLEARHPER